MISVIVPTYNRPFLLKKCLKSLMKQDYSDFEVIVVDDGSKIDTKLIVKKFPEVKYFRQQNKGPGAARNFGLEKASGDIIAFTDDDCQVPKNWLSYLESSLNKTDAVGGSLIDPTPGYISKAQYILNYSAWFPKGQKRLVRDIPTANIAYKKETISDLRFPEHPGSMVYEDTVLNHEIISKKGKILFNPKICVAHNTWQNNYGLKKYFNIQKKAALGFVKAHYVHGKIGSVLVSLPFLNLACPRLLCVFKRCARYGHLSDFLYHSPLLFLGEFYRGLVICKESIFPEKKQHPA